MTRATNSRAAARPQAARVLWILAGDCAVLALATAQVLGGEQRVVVVLTFVALALALVAVIGARALRHATRTGALRRLVVSVGLAIATLGALWFGESVLGWRAMALALAAFAGLALVVRWLVVAIEQREEQVAPWHELAGGMPAAPRQRRSDLLAAATGIGLLLAAGVGAVWLVLAAGSEGASVRGIVAGVVIVAVLMALVAGPVALVSQARARRAWADRERGRQRQAVAAHLHDSVLQTLALIQRSAGDERRVRMLARQQERGLREWLAGRDGDSQGTVVEALRAISAAVEDEFPGDVSIEVIAVGDATLTPAAEALVQAAREALRNAARHAGGIVRVVVDPDADAGELVVFVRDDGPGFDLTAVPRERRGVQDAIIGRMRNVGGSATIERSDGTEITLRVPASEGSLQ